MKRILTLIFSLSTFIVYCKTDTSKNIGTYADGVTKLEIKADGTFNLITPDFVFPYTFQNYQTSGNWICSNNEVILNPDRAKRNPTVILSEKTIANADSIEIKINYQTEEYENEVLVTKGDFEFEIMSLTLNESKKYVSLVHSPKDRRCGFAPKIKRQVTVDSTNSFKLPIQKVDKISINTYGFDETRELIPLNRESNYFEITVLQPIDKERIPRNKKVVIKGKSAFFYERNGKVVTSGFLINPLRKQVISL